MQLCLESVAQQACRPYEVIIADDGSADETAQVVREFEKSTTMCVKHVWHPDEGFRLGAIRNKAIAAAKGDYIVQIDGDILLHPKFICDHAAFAKPGCFVGGSRVLIGEALTEKIFASGQWAITFLTPGIHNRKNAMRLPFMAHVIEPLFVNKMHYRGCNMAFWREDLDKVNGYDEAFSGWGCEDHDLVARLINVGGNFMPLRYAAVCYHLWHASSKNDELFERNNRMLEQTRNSGRSWCEQGLNKYAK